MKAVLTFALSVLFFAAPIAAHAQDEQNKALHFENGYSFETIPSQKNGAAFVTITNVGGSDAKIIAAKSDVAESVELHTHIMEDDVMKMREVEGYDIPANQTITLKPHGDHIMLMGLKQPLRAGESFPLTLVSEDNGETIVDIAIKSMSELPLKGDAPVEEESEEEANDGDHSHH